MKLKNAKTILNEHLYNKFVYRLMDKNFNSWKENINLVNLEFNIDSIEAEQDMFLDDLTYHIYVKKKIQDEDEEDYDGEYCLYHEYHSNHDIYNNYFEIAKKRGLIETEYDEYDEYYEYDEYDEYDEYEEYKKNKDERMAELIGL